MKNKLVLLVSVLSLGMFAGCVSYKRTLPDGQTVSAKAFLMKAGDIESITTDTNGVKHTLTVKEISGDAATAAAVAEAVAKGITEGATK